MKIYLSNYRNHWLSPYTIIEKIVFWREIDYDEPTVKFWNNVLEPFSQALQKVLDFVHPKIDYVKIDKWDTWNMDYSLAHIILPMLKQLKSTKHGAPFVDDEDVPEELRSISAPLKKNEWDIDENHFKRWDWVLDEMIWSFEQRITEDTEKQFWDYSGVDKTASISEQVKQVTFDADGFKKHENRMANGFRMFGKYYMNFWD